MKELNDIVYIWYGKCTSVNIYSDGALSPSHENQKNAGQRRS